MSVVQPGAGLIGRYGTEADTAAYGRVSRLYASDPVMGTSGTANGEQITDNVADVPLGGRIEVTIYGNLTDEDFTAQATGTPVPPKIVPNGVISCSIQPPYAIGPAPIGQPPDSESVISDSDGD